MESEDTAQLRLERDLYRRLVELGTEDDFAPFLEAALALVVEVTGAERGYIELYARAASGGAPRFWRGRGFDDGELAGVRREISTGIVAEALATGRAISTASALEDPRFAGQGSVQARRIRAVLCVPVGEGRPTGVVYLQGRTAPGPFPEKDLALARVFARHLQPLAERLLEKEEQAPVADPTRELREKLRVSGLAGHSRALADLFRQMLVAAPVTMSVLITGESGTGKTAVARALHQSSAREAAPFVELNCAAIPETLFESELFGAEKGAHSTATRRIEGKVDAARGGTLLLDEIGEMPLATQSKLLSFLQSRQYYRLGGNVALEADVRVVAATNADLPARVSEKRFREDLFYRLGVLELHVPALRERRDDIGPIAEELARAVGAAHGRALPLSRVARLALGEAEWPGNVRQLENVVGRGWATAAAEGAPAIEARHLFPDRAAGGGEPEQPTYQEAVRAFQARFLRDALEATSWNVTETARRLELSRSHLNDLIKVLGLVRAKRVQ